MEVALADVRRILENGKNPSLPHSLPHEYEDKFSLAGLFSFSFFSLIRTLPSVSFSLSIAYALTRSLPLLMSPQNTCLSPSSPPLSSVLDVWAWSHAALFGTRYASVVREGMSESVCGRVCVWEKEADV